MLVSGQPWPLQGPVALGQAFAAASRDPPGTRRQPTPCTASPAAAAPRDCRHNTESGLDRVDPGADEQGAADGRAPAVIARAAAIASQADEAVEVVDAALDHSSHRDRAGGRRITVSTSEELQKTVDELAGTPGRPSRSNGGQHHAVVTPRVEASPDRSDFAKLGKTIAASLVVQAAQEHANHASVLLKQTKQFADDIRSQVAASSSDPSFHTHASGLMTCEATQDDIRGNPERQRESRCVMAGRAVNAHKAPTNEVGILATIDRQ